MICPASGPSAPPQPDRCDDTAYGKGAGGQLLQGCAAGRPVRPSGSASADRLRAVPGAGRATQGAGQPAAPCARSSCAPATSTAHGLSRCLVTGCSRQRWLVQADAGRLRAGGRRISSCGGSMPGHYPPPAHAESMRWLGAGWPDYPWLFGTDGEYTAFAPWRWDSSRPIKDHLRALRDVVEVDQRGQRQDRPRGHPGRRGVLRSQRRSRQHRRVLEVPLCSRADLALDG